MVNMSYISFNNVCKFYKNGESITRAADGINFTAEKGEFVVIVGPSGAGKTTVLNIDVYKRQVQRTCCAATNGYPLYRSTFSCLSF